MTKLFYYKYFPGDFSTGTQTFNMTEVGIYHTLLDYQFYNESIPNDQKELAFICKCTLREFSKYWQKVSLKFVPECADDGSIKLRNKRLQTELVEAINQHQKLSNGGKKGAQITKEKLFLRNKLSQSSGLATSQDTEQASDILESELLDSKENNIPLPGFARHSPLSPSVFNEKRPIGVKNENGNFFIKMFNELKGSPEKPANFKMSASLTKTLEIRIKQGYTSSDLEKAIVNCKNDQYHKENPKYLTPEFILRPEKLEKFLNASSVTAENIIGGKTYPPGVTLDMIKQAYLTITPVHVTNPNLFQGWQRTDFGAYVKAGV